MSAGRNRVRTGAFALVGVAVVATALWFTNRSAGTPAATGDCVTAPANGTFKKASCNDTSAAYQVLQVFAGHDANQCDQAAGTVAAVRETDGPTQKILCLGPRK